MKFSKIFLFILLLGLSGMMNAQNYYDYQWKKIDENSKNGLYKSNFAIVLEIQKQAQKDNNGTELIKSLKAEFSILNQTHDDTKNDEISQFFAKINATEKTLKGDDKLLLQVLSANFLQDYFQNNAWKINGRTNVHLEGEEIETWTKLDFKNELDKRYKELEKLDANLKKIPLEKYKNLFSGTKDLEFIPTLFDWKSINYIEFLGNRQLFTPNEIKENQPKILKIYDELIEGNSENAKLYFLHRKLNFNCYQNNCKDKLAQLQSLYNSTTEGDYKVLIANEIIENLISEKKNKEALAFINLVKKKYSGSKFLNSILNRENQILQKSVYIFYERETQSGKPIHIVAQHKNVQNFSVKIYETKDILGFVKYLGYPYENKLKDVKKSNFIREEKYTLPQKGDFESYKTSLEISPLKSGIYIAEIMVQDSVKQSFAFIASEKRVILGNKTFDEKNNIYKIINRENGEPIPNDVLEFHNIDNYENKYKIQKTNKLGEFDFSGIVNQNYRDYYLIETSGHNFSILNDSFDIYEAPDNRERFIAQIFTDRSIYRPGQTVYFKVINTKISGEKESVIAGISQKIILFDANNQELSAQNFTTNEFGSYSGNFILPKGKLNGSFSIRINNKNDASKYFQVEEYKRPNFEVEFEPIKGEYKYGETLSVKGKATSFSGIPLSNSTVNYEIKKQNIRWRYFDWYPRGNDNENSILGTVKTDEKGEFVIKIDLKKDEKIEGIQIDNYNINASIADLNGETQSAETNVKVSTATHYLSFDAQENSEKNSFFTDEEVVENVLVKNYNDQEIQKSYHYKLSKIDAPEKILRWNFLSQIQDLPTMSKAEFDQKFPHDLYENFDEDKNKLTVFDKIQQPNDKNILNLGKLSPGKYSLELYNIEGNDTIKVEKSFDVFDKKMLGNSQKPFLEIAEPKEYKRGEKAKIYVYSAVGNSLSFGEGRGEALLNVFFQNGDGKTKAETFRIKNGVFAYEFLVPADEKITILSIQFQIASYNDVQTKSARISLPEKEKLKIETVTFRDKIEPNSKEKWSVKILGTDKENVQAEVLANMYDKSLDKFQFHSFNWQSLYYRPQYFTEFTSYSRLLQEGFQEKISYRRPYNFKFPDFSWFDGKLIYLENQDTDGDGVEDDEDICPTVSGTIEYDGCPKPSSATAMEVESAYAPAPNAINALSGKASGIVIRGAMGMKRKSVMNADSANDSLVDIGEIKDVKIRQNLNETAFFYPNLLTDKVGNVSFEFTSPEALTQWKLMFLAHTKDARAAVLEKTVVTQKEFSVTPNYPRFLREGDELNLQSKLSNLTAQELNGSATLQILDAFTNEDISQKFGLKNTMNSFNLNENGNAVSNWKIKVPNGVSSIIFKVMAKAGNYSDGEQKAIPVLPNRMLVTDSQPIFVKEGQTKTFVLENLAKDNSATATNVSNTLELTTNPIWEVMFALPSLKDDQNLSADVQFNKWFADVLASEIFKANPKLKTVFDEYQNKGLLTSNLEKNQELKQLLLEETPWVLESKNETEQMQKLARIFDANTMRNSINQDWEDLKKLQNPDGGFSWVSGYPSSYQSSLYILKNLGKLNEWLKGNTADYQNSGQKEMLQKLVNYVDNEVNKYYRTDNLSKENIWNNFVLDYLDTRHYWENQFPLKAKGLELKNLVIKKAPTAKITDFTFFGLHRAALLFDDYKLTNLSKKLLTYLKETSTDTETQGVYWKQNLNDWGWYSSKTVNHAGALEAFQKLAPNDINFIEDLKIWLITQKEVSNWDTSRSTAEVIFTILNSGKSWTSTDSDKAEIVWGAESLTQATPSPLERVGERTTGYIKQSVLGDKINKDLATVTVKKDSPGIVQGGVFWQYYEDLDKIKSSENYISITKELYKKVKTVNGEELQKITENSPLKVGDKVTVRMILNTDRNMEFIHLKDMRAAGFEPLDVLSGYVWKNNLGYYQSTKDASTNFYIERMPKGKYIFEYDLICNASGSFSGGISTLQNYYAPQMNAHTKGMKVLISE